MTQANHCTHTRDGILPRLRMRQYDVAAFRAVNCSANQPDLRELRLQLVVMQEWAMRGRALRDRQGLQEITCVTGDLPRPHTLAPSISIRIPSAVLPANIIVIPPPASHGALSSALAYGDISRGRIIEAHTTTAWRWVKTAVRSAEELGAISPGKQVSTHTLRHSYARHLLMNGIPINYLSRWLGHSSIQTTLIYPELVPDPTGSLALVP